MSDGLTTVEASYQQVFPMAHLAIDPQIAGCQHKFKFEDHQVVIALPALPASDAPRVIAQQNPFLLSATIFVWNSAGEPMGVDVGSVKLTIEGLRYNIPSAAASLPHINGTLYTEDQRHELDAEADRLYLVADRAVHYWLRVLWWKTGFHLVYRATGAIQQSYDGGALIKADAGTRFYTPRISRTVVVSAQPIMPFAAWAEIDSALKFGEEPPVWHDYLTSGHQRMASGDRLAAILDLAVAAEARIRTYLDNQLPPGIAKGFRRVLRRQNASDVLTHWRAFGLPDFPELPCLKILFEIRNGIMHSGSEQRANAQFFQSAASAVAALISIL